MTEHNPSFAKDPLNGAIVNDTAKDFIPEDSPFDEAQRAYLNGLFSGLHALSTSGGAAGVSQTPLKVYYGSQTGTAESLCKDLRKFSATKGFKADLAELNSITPADLAMTEHVLIIAATCGEGDQADNALTFMGALMADDCPALPTTLNFSVCGLGDSSYAKFNQAAKEIDARLAQLGATRAADLVTCDLDYDDDFGAWQDAVFASTPFLDAAGGATSAVVETVKPAFDKAHPFMANLIDSTCLSGENSSKRVNHIEISLCGGGTDLDYEAGDALGVWPLNDMADVDAILQTVGFTGAELVMLKSGQSTLRQALFRALDLTTLTPQTKAAWGCDAQDDDQVLDVLDAVNLTPQTLVDGLRTQQPRLYSISSSPKRHPGEVHLTVGEVHYTHNARTGKGVTSTYLGDRLQCGGSVGVYVHKAKHFRLPDDDTVPIIMIGPGTGIAPFRAFLQEREARAATGDNWLFFGDQHEASDYLYSDEVSAWEASGLLSNLSLAWSRDTDEKVYAQHIIKTEGARFFEWLERGAAIYMCGDATRMATDVDRAIHQVVEDYGNMNEAAAKAYVDALRGESRYQRDVY